MFSSSPVQMLGYRYRVGGGLNFPGLGFSNEYEEGKEE